MCDHKDLRRAYTVRTGIDLFKKISKVRLEVRLESDGGTLVAFAPAAVEIGKDNIPVAIAICESQGWHGYYLQSGNDAKLVVLVVVIEIAIRVHVPRVVAIVL